MRKNKTREPLALKLTDRFVRPFLSKNLDYPKIREVLKLKLMLDRRRIPLTYSKGKKANEEPKEKSMILTSIIYIFFGIFLATMQFIPNIFVANVFSFGMLIFMLFSMYIGEYSAILLDTTEKPFFGILPIGEKELSTAKKIHIAYYIGLIAFSLMLPAVIASIFARGGLYALVFVVVSVFVTIFCLHLAGAMYFLLLKFFSGEKLKDILNIFQVGATITMIAAYQLIPRLLNFGDISKLDLSFNPYLFLLPSAWFSGIFSIIFYGTLDVYYYALTAIALLSVLLLGLFHKNKINTEFEGVLDKLTETEKENKSLSRLLRGFCKLFSKDRQERAFMEVVLIQISRDRSLKMKMYPQLANAVIIPLLFLFQSFRGADSLESVLNTIRNSPSYLSVYMVGISSAGIYSLISQTDNTESAMLYRILPIDNLSKCVRAGIKVVIFQYLTPIYIITATIFLAIYGPIIGVDIIVMYMVFVFVSSLTIRMTCFSLPFVNETNTNLGMGFIMFFINLLLLGGIAVLHYMFLKTILLKLLAIVGFLLLNLLLWKVAMNKQYKLKRY